MARDDASVPEAGGAGPKLSIARPDTGWAARPLDRLTAVCAEQGTVVVVDAQGREYFRGAATARVSFVVGGALGTHTVRLLANDDSELDSLTFDVTAKTCVEDGGRFRELFDILNRTMRCYRPDGAGEITWHGRTYRAFVPWMLDHVHTAKGMQYFSSHTAGLVDLMAEAQRQDGMIWSFARRDHGPGYYDTAYGPYGYAWRDGGVLFARQPVENHCEYNFVECVYLAWQGSGDDEWMTGRLEAATRALDYGVSDPARWSSRFELLKRGYTIDSWDFQVHDEYTVEFPLATAQMIDPDRTKFGVFFGDNTGYAYSCDLLAEMLQHAGREDDARRYRDRAEDIRRRLTEIAWNGRFYTHHVGEDPSVTRDLGVDETAQVAMSNAYALNRNIPHEQCRSILRTYLDMTEALPPGSPGEWYAIYPPFGRGFGTDSQRWQYMNAGVHGHAAGELARGAFEHGFERYGADILTRLGELGREHGGTVRFAYTGAYDPPPPAPQFTPLDISEQANMDLWDQGADGVPGWMGGDAGNDMRNLPTGRQEFAGIPFTVPDPATNGRRGAVAVSCRQGFPRRVEIPVNARAGAVHLLHAGSGVRSSGVAGTFTLVYEDGPTESTCILRGRHVTGWWFPELRSRDAGVAWRGPNPRSNDVGVCWATLTNPRPEQTIRSIALDACLEGPVYALMGVTLADRPPYHRPDPVSHGGPDNWSGGTCMFALMQGLAGIADDATALRRVTVSPRWTAADVDQVFVTAHYPASDGYVAYSYRHDAANRAIEVALTGSGDEGVVRLLLPDGTSGPLQALVDGAPAEVTEERVEQSRYAVVAAPLRSPVELRVRYGA
jgi:hypothetical protein